MMMIVNVRRVYLLQPSKMLISKVLMTSIIFDCTNNLRTQI